MARNESDREDLLREATALVERIELALPITSRGYHDLALSTCESVATSIVIGFRACGAMSIFFGADPVYQLNAAGELRRAYCDGLLFKATRRRLVSLQRVRQPNEVQMVRRDLTDAEQVAFIAKMQARMNAVSDALARGSYQVVGQVPAEGDALSRVREWLATHNEFSIAETARV
jgi:hypothetical protein